MVIGSPDVRYADRCGKFFGSFPVLEMANNTAHCLFTVAAFYRREPEKDNRKDPQGET